MNATNLLEFWARVGWWRWWWWFRAGGLLLLWWCTSRRAPRGWIRRGVRGTIVPLWVWHTSWVRRASGIHEGVGRREIRRLRLRRIKPIIWWS